MRTKLFLLLAALICATTSWAQTNVSTDQELRNAITNGANIQLTADHHPHGCMAVMQYCTFVCAHD